MSLPGSEDSKKLDGSVPEEVMRARGTEKGSRMFSEREGTSSLKAKYPHEKMSRRDPT